MKNKDDAYSFLKILHKSLNESVPAPDILKDEINQSWNKIEKTEREKLESKENIPFYKLVIPKIFELGKSTATLTDTDMKKALRCVYHGKFPEFSLSNVRRRNGHPFSKKWGLSPDEIMKAWQNPAATTTRANEAWPEAGLSSPFPFKILFEAKYFEEERAKPEDAASVAQRELVKAVYETFYYRGLPSNEEWGFDFGCLVAYDVSSKAYLKAAWESVRSKRLFWEDASIFVMIIRGETENRQN